MDYTPEHSAEYQNTLIQIDSQLTDELAITLTSHYGTRNFMDTADYDHAVSVVNYAIAPITVALGKDNKWGHGPVRGSYVYASDQAIDRAANESEWWQNEIRITSDYDGNFNFTAGIFRLDTDSSTDYHITTPYLSLIHI